MTQPILQDRLPHAPWMTPVSARLPGTQPVEGEDWLRMDEAFAGQMAERDRLIAAIPETVHAQLDEGRPAADELYEVILERLARTPGYVVADGQVTRPDGVVVPLDASAPLMTLGRLVQEDLCIMERREGEEEHKLTGACLCFPASWSLSEKIGRPMIGIHRTVKVYEPDMAARVQRMLGMIRPGNALWRMNAFIYRDPTLHQPSFEAAPRTDRTGGAYVRAERQCLVRLPRTQAILFTIHTYVILLDSLSEEEREGLMGSRL